MKLTTSIIVVAYPDAYVSTVSRVWYNKFLKMSGISQCGKVCAGHAAMVLLERQTGRLHYADFGRYITARGMGRVRIQKTDPEVKLEIKGVFDNQGNLKNLADILLYLEANPQKTHGEGRMFAGVSHGIDFKKAFNFINHLNTRGGLPYGPFVPGGSNCSRFVADVIKTSTERAEIRKKFSNPLELTPSPMGNIAKGIQEMEPVWVVHDGICERFNGNIFSEARKCFFRKSEVNTLKLPVSKAGTIIEPEGVVVPVHAQWLGGTGAGSWFLIDNHAEMAAAEFRIRRINETGELMFDRLFAPDCISFDLSKPHKFMYDSNAHWCYIMQHEKRYRFSFTRNF